MRKSNKILAVIMALVIILTTVPMMTAGAAEEKHTHLYVQQGEATKPTCTIDGKTTFKCDCGDVKVVTAEALGHNLIGSIDKKDDNVHTQYCDTCKKQIEEKHDFKVFVETTNAPTCTEAGKKVLKCTKCDAKKEVVADATGHNYGTNEVTAIEGDKHDGKCTVCNAQKSEAHVWEAKEFATVEVAPKCNAAGKLVYECTKCDKTKEEAIPAAHSFGAWTATEDGKHTRECTACGAKETVAHTVVAKIKTPATCSAEGKLALTCSVEGCPFVAEEDIATSEHTFDKDSYENYTALKHKATCTVCNTEVKEAHTYDDGKVTVEATCFKEGTKTFTCVCGRIKTEKVDKLDHTWGEWEVKKEATATEEGVKERVCTVKGCDAKETEKIDKVAFPVGDVNGDSKVQAIDARLILQYVAETKELSADEIARADIVGNGDGVKATDARKVLQIVAGNA